MVEYEPGDLSIALVSEIQAPDTSDFIVNGKLTLIKAKIKNTFTSTKTADIRLTAFLWSCL